MFFSGRNRSRQGADKQLVKLDRAAMNEMRRLFRYLHPYKRAMAVAIVSLLLGSVLGLVFPWIMQNLVDTVLAQGNRQTLNQITLVLILTFLMRSIFYYFQGYFLSYVGERIVVDLRTESYRQMHSLSLSFFSETRVGELISRLASDVTLVRAALTNNVATVLSQIVTFAGSLVLMVILNWRLTLYILSVVPFIVGSAAIFGSRLRKLATVVQDELADSNAMAEEALIGVRVVKSFRRETYEVLRYAEQVKRTFQVVMRQIKMRSAFGPLISFFAFAALTGVLWVGGREVLEGRLTAGALIAFLIYGINIAGSLGAFTSLYTQLQEAAGATHRIFDLLDLEPEIQDHPGAVSLGKTEGRITFENLSFSYLGAGHVLYDMNLEIEPGEIFALVGPSGAGKSTLFNLIPRFYDPTSGRILLDGIDLREITLESLRTQIGVVPQETQLFSATIRENILYGRLEASDAEINAAAVAANADEFILRQPDGYATQVGERGVKLSGGQRQRIAIARALLSDPRILLLDEATSSLDSESEGLVQEALERLMIGRTTIIIAHRLSTVHLANRIAVLDQGRIVELGSHAQLLESDGLYARLYKLQLREDKLIA
jgi:ATP-binding cassette, subfamily B, bacterial MsbA